ERDHRRLKLHDRLEEEGVLEGGERAVRRLAFWQRLRLVQRRQTLEIFASNLDQCDVCRWENPFRMLHEPVQKPILHPLEARLAQGIGADEDNDQDKPRRRTTHWRRS